MGTVVFSFYDFIHPGATAQSNDFQWPELFGTQSNDHRNLRWQMDHPFPPLANVLLELLFVSRNGIQWEDDHQHFLAVCRGRNLNPDRATKINVPKLERIELAHTQR